MLSEFNSSCIEKPISLSTNILARFCSVFLVTHVVIKLASTEKQTR